MKIKNKKILLIDNYDSFVYNLLHYLGELGAVVDTIRNDELTVAAILDINPDGIVISPGPCAPDSAGICLELVKKAAGEIPILGVCLGHQTIAQAFGGEIIRADVPMHGKVSNITHNDSVIFNNIPSPFNVTRYHSLIAKRSTLPDCFDITSETKDGIIMAISHKKYNIHGVQFHPESIKSEHGHQLLQNFLDTI